MPDVDKFRFVKNPRNSSIELDFDWQVRHLSKSVCQKPEGFGHRTPFRPTGATLVFENASFTRCFPGSELPGLSHIKGFPCSGPKPRHHLWLLVCRPPPNSTHVIGHFTNRVLATCASFIYIAIYLVRSPIPRKHRVLATCASFV